MKIYKRMESFKQEAALLVPLYKGDRIPDEITELLGYDVTNDICLNYETINETLTMGKAEVKKIIFAGLGEKEKLTRSKLRKFMGKLARKEKGKICVWLDSLDEDKIFDIVYGMYYSMYSYLPKEDGILSYASDKDVEGDIRKAMSCAAAINHARHLGNTPPNHMHPEDVANDAKRMAENLGLRYEILTNKELKEMGAGALLGVNQGSAHEARLITLWYQGDGDAPYTALVGKGITFDSGGYNLKSAAGMHWMKLDMCGGANVLGAMQWLATKKVKANVMAVVAATENMIGPDAYTCDSVLTSLSGKTIEITNTDAEGRLILCDAITYAQQKGAKRIIDVATLTGAVIGALGTTYTGVFTNSDAFYQELKHAAEKTEEKIWQLPVDEDFHSQIRLSDVADMVNSVSGGKGGASLAAAFLEEFIEDGIEWIHLDIAGSADTDNGEGYRTKGATGAMVETMAALFEK